MDKINTRSGNRLELLLSLGSDQQFGINVLKMHEVIPLPALTQIPQSHPTVKGMIHLRGMKLPIIDLSHAIKNGRLPENPNNLVIITEFNRRILGFLVSAVDRINGANTILEKFIPEVLALSAARGLMELNNQQQ